MSDMNTNEIDPVQPLEVNEAVTSGKNVSYWVESIKPVEHKKLNENIDTDVVVVGGGISGVTIAYRLTGMGLKVALIEDGFIGSGETGRTTAHISNALDDRYFYIKDYFGDEGAKLAAQSHTAAIDFIEATVKKEKIKCDFTRLPGYLFLHPSDKYQSLEDELIASQNAGLKTEMLDTVPGILGNIGSCVKFPDQATFHPLKYLEGLCKVITKRGGRIFTRTHVSEVESYGVTTKDGFRVSAKHIVVATNTPINDRFVMHTKQAPYRTYVIAGLIPKNVLPNSLWWDTGDHNSEWNTYPYHYVRLQPYDDTFDLLISGGNDHKTGQPDEEKISEEHRYANLESWTRDHFPALREVKYRWSGQVMEPVDFMGFIGRNPLDSNNVYIVTGDSGNGMTHGTISGILISDLITGVKNEWIDLYDPARKTLKAIGDFVTEQGNVAKQYTEYISVGNGVSVENIKPGEGGIIKNGFDKIAVFRDHDGTIHSFNAACPHLKCIVEWNNDEKTFDCPCHGSRFSNLGKVINGPANVDLKKVKLPEP